MAKINLTKSQVNTIVTHAEKVKGTVDFAKYNMETEVKYFGDKKYTFVGWGVPNAFSDSVDCYISRGFIYKVTNFVTRRYRFTNNVKELLGL